VPIDTVEINDDDFLFRRLAPNHLYPDGTVNSNAYKLDGKPDPEISVDLAKLTEEVEALARAGRPGFRLGLLQVRDIRSRGLTIRHDPTEENPAHCVIEGNNSKAICRKLAEITSVTVPPAAPENEATTQ